MQAVGGAALNTDNPETDRTATDSATTSGTPPVGDPDTDRVGPPRSRIVLWFTAAALTVLAVDVVTKIMAVAALEGRAPLRLLDGAVYLVLTRNSGAAFGLGQGYTVVLTVLAVVVIAVIVRFARRLGSVPWALALGMVLGGAAGNLVDRIFRSPGPLRGAVVDFVSILDDSGDVWPVFNVADSALVTGVVLAVLLELTGRRLEGHRVGDSPGDTRGGTSGR